MNILSQILNIETKNLIINQISYSFKLNLSKLLDDLINNINTIKYYNIFIELQSITNKICLEFIKILYEAIDNIFKNSIERKNKYFINKSNVKRTLITIFGTVTFERTLYINKYTSEYYFYVDDVCKIDSYKNYDPLIRAIIVEDSIISNPNNISKFSSLNRLSLKEYLNNSLSIPKQTIYKIKQETTIKHINYEEIPVSKVLYVMVDEKWIHEQDKNNKNARKYIMSKCFVTFTGIERKGKRSRLTGRHIFITTSDTPWKDFMGEIYKIYNFEQIETINLLSDAGSWILSGASELKLYSNNKVKINTCEFHVKQKINRSTTDKNLRMEIANLIYEKEDKKSFIKEMDKLIESATKETRKQKITEYKNYILNHWKGILNMKYSLCKSSMESHIQHCVASMVSAVPKGYSKKYIETYIKLQEAFLNEVNIMDYYLKTYNTNESYEYNKKEVNYSLNNQTSSNVPILYSSSNVANAIYSLINSGSCLFR